MSRDRRTFIQPGPQLAWGPRGEWSLRTTTTMAAVSLGAGARARLRVAGGDTSLSISNAAPYVGGRYERLSWSAGFEVDRGPALPPGVFVRLRASYFEAPEDPDPDGPPTCDAALRRSSAAVLVGRSAPRGRAYCGVRVSSARAYNLIDSMYEYHLTDASDLGVVVGLDGEVGGASVFLEAGFLDSTGVPLGMTWSR